MIEAFTGKRRRLGWSLRDVERESGIAFSTLARFERGERIGARVAAGIATWISDPDPTRRLEVALTREGRYLVGYSNEGEAGGFILLGDVTEQLQSLNAPPAGTGEVEQLRDGLNRIADLGSCAGGKLPAYRLFQQAIDIATAALSHPRRRAMGEAWQEYADDFNAMSDAEIEEETERSRREVEEHESWLEAVASWEAAGRPRHLSPKQEGVQS